MITRSTIIRMAKIAVEALNTITRAKCRSGSGQRIASDDMSTRERIAASAAQAIPAVARIRPNCR